ncbi:MAG: hypothetical protein ACOCQD_00200 [archaeon]
MEENPNVKLQGKKIKFGISDSIRASERDVKNQKAIDQYKQMKDVLVDEEGFTDCIKKNKCKVGDINADMKLFEKKTDSEKVNVYFDRIEVLRHGEIEVHHL